MNTPHCHRREGCRLCAGTNLSRVLSLTPTPPANAFVPESGLSLAQEAFPLDLFLCEDCAHVQLLDVVDPELLFANYVYVSGTSPVFVKHFEDYARWVQEKYHAKAEGQFVLDVGSNDGTLLAQFKNRGFSVLGIDPARDIARQATENGIETHTGFFTSEFARKIKSSRGPAQIITANNVFAHADDLTDITQGVRELLAPDGVFVFEVSYLVDVFEKTLFDTIYHEHLAYHSVKPLVTFFESQGLEMIAAERVSSHGGSLRGVAQLAGATRPVQASVAELIALEEDLGLDRTETLQAFGRKIDALKAELTKHLHMLKDQGKTIAAFGAPAKATTLMYHFEIGPDVIDFIVDDSPLKQELYSPGMHIPVVPSQELYNKKPAAVIILAWNFSEPIMRNHKQYIDQGGTFIVPLPEVGIFTS